MRIAEKTIELNFCAQCNTTVSPKLLWFGLTQKQEAKMGFDACTSLKGRLLIFQFKASNYVLASGSRRFYAPHDQLVQLQKQCNSSRSVFYVFPLVGTTLELSKNPNILSSSWLLDVATLPSGIAVPTTTKGKPRKNGMHYVDVVPGSATIHSDPFKVGLLSADEFLSRGIPGSDGFQWQFEGNFGRFWEFRSLFSRNAVGLVAYA
jgi:hypothetical protein